jgi:hypothetical protein
MSVPHKQWRHHSLKQGWVAKQYDVTQKGGQQSPEEEWCRKCADSQFSVRAWFPKVDKRQDRLLICLWYGGCTEPSNTLMTWWQNTMNIFQSERDHLCWFPQHWCHVVFSDEARFEVYQYNSRIRVQDRLRNCTTMKISNLGCTQVVVVVSLIT